MKKQDPIKFVISDLQKTLKQNTALDFKVINLNGESEIKTVKSKGIKDKDALIKTLKAYQRLLRIVPDNDTATAVNLLKHNIHSAVQIASLSKREFVALFTKKIKGKQEQAEVIYQNALTRRSNILVRYMNVMQNNEPHIKAAKFN